MQEIQMSRKTAAYKVHMDIMAAGEVAAEAFSTFCRLLKTMRDDKLYAELEYSSFEAYCENAVGLKQAQAYAYIKAYEDFGDENSTRVEKLGIKKLKLLGTVPKESREEFMEDKNLEDMTTREVEKAVKEYKDKLKAAEAENAKSKEWAEEQIRQANSYQNRARQAEFDLEKSKTALEAARSDCNYIRQQLDQAKRNSDPEKVRELGQRISKYQEEIQNYQKMIRDYNQQIGNMEQQLHDKPIEVPATKIIEKEIIPDEVALAVYDKVVKLYEGIVRLTDKEIQVYAEQVEPDYYDDIRITINDAIIRLEDVLSAAYEATTRSAEPEGHCGDCAHADMDGVSDEQLDDSKTLCTVTNQIVEFEHTCSKYERYGG